jgi:hypothetical protein
VIEALLGLALLTALPLGLGIAAATAVGLDRGRITPIAATLGALAAAGLLVPRGPVALALALPWIGLVGAVAIGALARFLQAVRRSARSRLPLLVGTGAALAFLAVGCLWLAADRLGLQPLGFSRTVVLLTATHFHVAGFVLTLAGVLVAERGRRDAGLATAVLVVGFPMTAAGFLGAPVVGWVGSIVVAVAGIVIGWATLRHAGRDTRPRGWLRIAGTTLFVTMPLAAAYSTGTTFGISTLDVPAMAAIHGGLNVAGFAIPAMVGWALDR